MKRVLEKQTSTKWLSGPYRSLSNSITKLLKNEENFLGLAFKLEARVAASALGWKFKFCRKLHWIWLILQWILRLRGDGPRFWAPTVECSLRRCQHRPCPDRIDSWWTRGVFGGSWWVAWAPPGCPSACAWWSSRACAQMPASPCRTGTRERAHVLAAE